MRIGGGQGNIDMWTRRGFGLTAMAAGMTTGLAAATGVRAQEAITPEQRLRNEGRYLPHYLALKARLEAGDDEMARAELSQYAAFLGDEATALGLVERPPHPRIEGPDMDAAEARDAIDAIVEGAGRTRVVILNEAHNISGHRAFAAAVARALRPLGYDWFAAEAFVTSWREPTPSIGLYREGMPFTHQMGWYTQDPVFAETVREAARLGYRFADYEQTWLQRPSEDLDSEARIAAREQAQAENLIANVLAPYPDAKVFVFVGYSHAMEKPGLGGTWFAARLKALTGIDPLTIEQSSNWPALDPVNDARHVAAVLAKFAPTAPIVVSSNGLSVGSRGYAGQMDLSVFHPRREAVSGRPGWLAADPMRQAVEVAVPPFEGPALLQVMRTHEGPAGVPADQFLLQPGQERATLMLHPGAYFLRLERPGGNDPAYGAITVEPAPRPQ